MAVAKDAFLEGLQKGCLEDIVNLMSSYDAYWCYQHAQSGKLPQELAVLRKFVRDTPKLTLQQLTLQATRLLAGKKAHCLSPLYGLMLKADKAEDLPGVSKQLRNLLREARDIAFAEELKRKNGALALAKTRKDKTTEARLHYELGVLYVKKDPVKYRKEAMEQLNQAIELDAADIRAYALRERAALQEEEEAKRADLEQAYKIVKSLRAVVEAEPLKERWRVFFSYGMLLLQSAEFAEAGEVFSDARKLRNDHGPTISALLQAYNGLKKYTHPLECLKDIELDASGLEGVDAYLKQMGKALWLELAACGSVTLIERCAPHLDKQEVDREGNNALHYAAKEGHLEASRCLGRWLSYDSRNKKGMTPVMAAAEHGRVALVLEYLFKQGVSSSTEERDILSVIISAGQGCVFLGLVEKEKAYEELLVQMGKRYSEKPLAADSKENHEQYRIAAVGQMVRTAIDAKNLTMLKLLISRHPEGLHCLVKGEAPLHYAIHQRFAEGLYLLAEQGADLEQENLRKQRPLDIARAVDRELASYLSNALGRKKLILGKIQGFIESAVKQFNEAAKTLPGLSPFTRAENLNLLTESLKQVFNKVVYYPLFEEDSEKLPLLLNVLVTTLIEKVQQPGELTSGVESFDREKLVRLIESIVHSPWQKAPSPEAEAKEGGGAKKPL